MKFFVYSVAAALLVSGGSATALAKGPQQPEQQLRKALNTIARSLVSHNGHTPPGQSARPVDPDRGDDNAALQAILTVCTKDTPAAQRSAICDGQPISP